MPNYYDSLVAELMMGGMPKDRMTGKRISPILSAGYLPQGMTEQDVLAGVLGGGFDEKTARRLASGAEDVMLRGNLGGKYELPEDSQMPQGNYSGAEFPGMRHQLWALQSGMMPRFGRWDPGESQEDTKERQGRQAQFADFQKAMLGIDQLSSNDFINKFKEREALRRMKQRGNYGYGGR